MIAEIAGKDSISAIIQFNNITKTKYSFIPSIVYTGTEFGRMEAYKESIEFLKQSGIYLTQTHELHNEDLWNILNIKYQYLLNNKYGFFTPCIMCHFYTHLLRVPLYIDNNAVGIITGERLSHDGRIKLNQHKMVLDCFREMFSKHNINIVQPLLNISDTSLIDNNIGSTSIKVKANDVKCILSNNLFGFSLDDSNIKKSINNYLFNFVTPIGHFCINSIVNQNYIDITGLENLIREILND